MNRIKIGICIGLTCLMLIGCQEGIRNYIGAVGLTRVHADEINVCRSNSPSTSSFIEKLGRSIRHALYASAREVYEQRRAGESSASDRSGDVGTDEPVVEGSVLPQEDGNDAGQYLEVSPGNIEPEVSEWTYYGYCRITFYDDCEICCNVAGNTTASGVYPTPQHTVASGPDLPFGTELLIDGQVYVAEDRGVGEYEIDVFVPTHAEALERGMYFTDVYMRYAD